MALAQYRFDLSSKKACSVKSFVMRETTGADEENAAVAAKAKGGAMTPTEELVRLSIVSVDGKPVDQPYLSFDSWNTRTRNYAIKAWASINGVDEKDAKDFLDGAEALAVSASGAKSGEDSGVSG